MESVHADPLTGRMLDRRYHVRSRIAHGGMATVYLATDTRLDREVALKVMHADLARDGDFVSRFIGEAKSVAKLSHPNIVGVYDQGADGQYLYLVMEYVPGWTLRAMLQERGWLPWQEALSVMDPVLAGLAAAHQAGIVHRDVKPENVLITADGRVKVVDFGLARATAAVGNTRAGQIIGSVSYIAPEQVTGGRTDARTDVYSAGITLFEILTGRKPFTGESPLAIAYAHVNSDVPTVSTVVGGIPPSVDQLVRAATSRDPQLRPGDAGVFLRVTRALRGMPEPADAAGGPWAGPAAAGPGDGAVPANGGPAAGVGSRTMIVSDPGYTDYPGHDGGGTGRFGSAFAGLPHGNPDGHRRAAALSGAGQGEPFLQRWLFSKRLVYLVLAAALLAALGGGGWWLASGRYTKVPAVSKLTAAQAEQSLRQAGFQVQSGPTVVDDNVPKGEVVSTSPSGRALPGATIVLTISKGPRMISVPQIPAGDSVTQAQAALRAAGLTVDPTPKAVGGQSFSQIGTVAGTTPPAGTSWPENQPVAVNEIEGLALPDLRNQNISFVQQWASQNQITVNPATVQSNQPQGTVVAQSPAPGTPVKQGATISVQVSNGPPETPIPDLSGQNCQQAQQTLQAAGFQVQVQQSTFGNPFGGQVQGTTPSGQAPAGSTVVLQCSRFHFG
jgi:eukaryotic-like serine/threonine-protein kinase